MNTDHAMTAGVIPIRSVGLPGVVKLPRRYEQAALGDSKTARYRRVSICSGPSIIGDGMSQRLNDLLSATMWVKQELILLRQHDILLKRQFFDIHNSIQSLQPHSSVESPCSSTSSSLTMCPSTSPCASVTSVKNVMASASDPADPHNSSDVISIVADCNSTTSSTPSSSPVFERKRRESGYFPAVFSEFFSQIRPSCSALVLNNIDDDSKDDIEDSDGDDTFDEIFTLPRTMSTKTSRDLAALARRRGSKELV